MQKFHIFNIIILYLLRLIIKNSPMKRIFFATILLTIGFSLILNIPPVDSKVPDTILEQKKTIVTIYINDKDGKHIFSGSGFIIDQNGIIATNCLVIAKWLEKVENTFDVELQGGVHLPIEELISSKCKNNLALFKVDAKGLPAVKLAADYIPKQGENIVVIRGPSESGSPFLDGIVKSVRKKDKLFHISIPVTPDLSGSPVFNIKGEVIGAAVLLKKKRGNSNYAVLLKDIKQLARYRKPKTEDLAKSFTPEKEENKKPVTAEDYFSLGCAFDKANMYREAIEAYEQSLRIKPDFVEAYVNLGVDYYRFGKYEAAIDMYKRAIQIKPDCLSAYNKLGTAYLTNGAYLLAVETFRKAVDIDPNNAVTRFNLGLAYFLNGERAAAYQEYIILKDIDKNHADSLIDLIY